MKGEKNARARDLTAPDREADNEYKSKEQRNTYQRGSEAEAKTNSSN